MAKMCGLMCVCVCVCLISSLIINLSSHNTENYSLLSRVRNKPYDVFGCWLNETHLISGNLHWIGNMTSCSVLWLNKAFQVRWEPGSQAVSFLNVDAGPMGRIFVACILSTSGTSFKYVSFLESLQLSWHSERKRKYTSSPHHPLLFLWQDVESENVNVVKRLFKIQNINASTIRTVMVAHCRRHDTPDLLLDYEAQSQARRQNGQQQQNHQPLLFDLGTSGSEEEEEEEQQQREAQCPSLSTGRFPQPAISGLEHVLEVREVWNSKHFHTVLKMNLIFILPPFVLLES